MKLKTIRLLLPFGLSLLLAGNARAQQRDYRKDFLSLYHLVQRSFYDSAAGFYTDVDESATKKADVESLSGFAENKSRPEISAGVRHLRG